MENPLIATIKKDGPSHLKKHIVDYVGSLYNQEDVTVEMVAAVLASEFPEFLFVYAQENFIRGYETGVSDSLMFEEEIGADDAATK